MHRTDRSRYFHTFQNAVARIISSAVAGSATGNELSSTSVVDGGGASAAAAFDFDFGGLSTGDGAAVTVAVVVVAVAVDAAALPLPSIATG